ncbi:MAG TPA: HAMP domain-containing sensor histidine kinase [Elusimicrobiota bacterium]|jgi:signal transduction histidine kinase|nr:HAMP domain-containing sensor histidine kinase [Elusimicrobiota bacterium]
MNDADQAALIRRIASVVGHEMRNPMAVINNSAYFVRAKLGGSSLDPKVEKHLKIIESEIARADRLISDILSYSRVCEPMKESRPVDALVEAAVKAYEAPADGKVEFKAGAKDAAVKADPKLVGDALKRLLDNAFDAMEGKGAAKVATGSGKEGVWVSVTDSGAGVDAKIKGSLFEPFVTTKPRGLGLGLALAKKVLEAQGGSADYQPGAKGSTFRLVLPKA